MNKEYNKSSAGLRRSAVAERIRLREEWSQLKGTESQKAKTNSNILTKKQTNSTAQCDVNTSKVKESTRTMNLTTDTLRGVVALVEVGAETRALPLRAALSALGASVLPIWSPLVTHLVWSQGGCRASRSRSRALGSVLVSPLWVEACAAAARRLPERAFPAAARASDLPSPRTLRVLLKKAEMENIPLADLLSNSHDENQKALRLRMSSETEQDTSAEISADTSRDTSKDTSHDTDVESRVNTAQRRALPKTSESVSPPRDCKSRRKLFTHKEVDLTRDEESDENQPPKPRKPSIIKKPSKPLPMKSKSTPNRRELARAERLAKKILDGCTPTVAHNVQRTFRPRIVLTGMSRTERREVTAAIKSLNGRIQGAVDRRTTHVLLGSCTNDHGDRTQGIMTGVPCPPHKPRTVSALLGAARGVRVLRARWAIYCAEGKCWRGAAGYEVTHLRKIAQKARLERIALGKQRSEYAYDVFNGMRVRIAANAEQRDAARELLRLCGAHVLDGASDDEDEALQDGVPTQNGGQTQNAQPTQGERTKNGVLTQNGATQNRTIQNRINTEYDIKIGIRNGEISSKWVFDSVAAGRMRTTRRYVINTLSQSDLVTEMQRFHC